MSKKSKTYLTGLLVLGVVGAISYQSSNSNLFQGQLQTNTTEQELENQLEVLKPDLTADLTIIAPEEEGGDIVLDVTIRNQGPGVIEGQNFNYEILLNNEVLFSNTDLYSRMEADDTFNFQYSVSRLIYEYSDEGTASVIVDTDDDIDETNEENNQEVRDYFL